MLYPRCSLHHRTFSVPLLEVTPVLAQTCHHGPGNRTGKSSDLSRNACYPKFSNKGTVCSTIPKILLRMRGEKSAEREPLNPSEELR